MTLEKTWSPHLEEFSADPLPNAAKTVILGQKHDVPSVLKRAYYELLRTSGFGQAEWDLTRERDTDGRKDDDSVLSADDLHLLVKAREQLTAAWVLATADASDSFNCPRASLSSKTRCCKHRAVHAKLVYGSGLVHEYLLDPMSGLQLLMDAKWAEEGFCNTCRDQRLKIWKEMRRKMWENLDIWLELPELV